MTTSNSRIDLLKEAMSIETERAALQLKLDGMLVRLKEISDSLFAGGMGAVTVPSPVKVHRGPLAGSLKDRILKALEAAGAEGMRVKDLAVVVNSKQATLHSWFQFARKSVPEVRKLGPGRYGVIGSGAGRRIASVVNVAAATGDGPAFAKLNKRGELAESVLNELRAADGKGVAVSDMARKFDVKPRNLFVWFSTTAKKYKGIKKVGPGLYCFKG